MAVVATSRRLASLCKNLSNLKRVVLPQTLRQLSSSYEDLVEGAERKLVTLIPGDGVGPELVGAVKHVFSHLGVPIDWDELYVSDIGAYGETSISNVLNSMKKTGVALKGALTTPSSVTTTDHIPLNHNLKLQLDLFANVVHCKTIPGIKTRHDNIDLVVIREQTEGEYSSLEHESIPGVVEMLKVITRKKSHRVAKFAFDYAMKKNRKKITCIHKANIMKLGDGLFLQSCQEISKMYPKIKFESMIVDNTCMQLVSNPQQFDILLTPSLYGTIVDNVSAGLVGGAGVVPGISFGREYAIFEAGARHTYAHMAGRNVANPTAMLLSSCDMLEHMHLRKHAKMIRDSILRTIKEAKYLTMDMGGSSSNSIFTNRIIQNAHTDMLR